MSYLILAILNALSVVLNVFTVYHLPDSTVNIVMIPINTIFFIVMLLMYFEDKGL